MKDRFHSLPRRAQSLLERAPQVDFTSARELPGAIVRDGHDGQVWVRTVRRYQRTYFSQNIRSKEASTTTVRDLGQSTPVASGFDWHVFAAS